jgi:hypothetical protein
MPSSRFKRDPGPSSEQLDAQATPTSPKPDSSAEEEEFSSGKTPLKEEDPLMPIIEEGEQMFLRSRGELLSGRKILSFLESLYADYCVPWMEYLIDWLQKRSIVIANQDIHHATDKGAVALRLLGAFLHFCLSYTDLLCYVAFVLKFTVHPSALTLVPPFTMFVYALLVEAPSRTYWNFMLFWFQMLVVVWSFMTMLDTTSNTLRRLCEQYNIFRMATQDPAQSLLFDLAILLCITLHRNEMLKFRILEEEESDSAENTPLLSQGTSRDQTGYEYLLAKAVRVGQSLQTWLANMVHRRKVGRDLYFRSFVAGISGFIVLLFSFDSIVGRSQDFVSSVQNNLLPGALVLALFGYFLAMMLDRVCFLARSVVLKAVWHFLSTFAIFYAAYKYLVVKGQNQFQLQLLMWVTFSWLAFSAQQIYQGYPQTIGSSWLMAGYQPQRHVLYICYRAIPFVFEMKSLLDWSCTATTLKMNQWLKLEDIHHELVLARADRMDTKLKARPRGAPFPFRLKCYTGCLMFTTLCVLLFFPLMYYSSFSPALAPNNVNMTRVSLQFQGTSAIFEGQIRLSDDELPTLEQSSYMAMALGATRPGLADVISDKFVQVMSFSDYSLTIWGVSPPIMQQLLSRLQTEVSEFEMLGYFTRSRGIGGPQFAVNQNYTVPVKFKDRLIELLQTTNKSEIILPNFYCPFIMNAPLSVHMIDERPQDGRYMQDCKLAYEKHNAVGYWQVKCRSLFKHGNNPTEAVGSEKTCIDSGGFRCSGLDYSLSTNNRDHKWVPLYFVTMSAEVPKRSGLGGLFQSFSIVTIYTTFVLTAGRVIRLVLTGSAQRVVLEDMKYPDALISLVEDIKLARAEGELALEEDLFEELISIYRSPELIKQWTVPP